VAQRGKARADPVDQITVGVVRSAIQVTVARAAAYSAKLPQCGRAPANTQGSETLCGRPSVEKRFHLILVEMRLSLTRMHAETVSKRREISVYGAGGIFQTASMSSGTFPLLRYE
jgi:hypothetical protein